MLTAAEELVEQTRVVVELGTEAQPRLIRISIGPPPTGMSSLDSYALRTDTGWIFIDPVRPTRGAAERLARLIRERPVATVLTSDGHERFCYAVRERWGTPVWGPPLGQDDAAYGGDPEHHSAYGGEPDHLYMEGDCLPGGLRPLKLAGLWRGDHALLWSGSGGSGGERVVFSGDVVNGQVETELARPDHWRREPGLYLGSRPHYVERHAKRGALRGSLERLLGEDFDVIAGSHARPFRDDPKAALARLIDSV